MSTAEAVPLPYDDSGGDFAGYDLHQEHYGPATTRPSSHNNLPRRLGRSLQLPVTTIDARMNLSNALALLATTTWADWEHGNQRSALWPLVPLVATNLSALIQMLAFVLVLVCPFSTSDRQIRE